jgi:hypothetical protein
MPVRKLFAIAALAGLIASAAACSDITAPQKQTGVCQVSGGGQTCVD